MILRISPAYRKPKEPITFDPLNPVENIYSRYTQDNSTRAERILSKINVSRKKR